MRTIYVYPGNIKVEDKDIYQGVTIMRIESLTLSNESDKIITGRGYLAVFHTANGNFAEFFENEDKLIETLRKYGYEIKVINAIKEFINP